MVWRLVANFLATAETLSPAASSTRASCFCFSLRLMGGREFPLRLGPLEAGFCPLDQQIAFKLCDGIEDVHGHRAGRAGEINATLVPTCRNRPGYAKKPKWQGKYENPLVAGASRTAVIASVPCCHRSPDAQKSGRRHHHQIGRSCLWLIKAAYDLKQLWF
jgi:hypothetical protein